MRAAAWSVSSLVAVSFIAGCSVDVGGVFDEDGGDGGSGGAGGSVIGSGGATSTSSGPSTGAETGSTGTGATTGTGTASTTSTGVGATTSTGTGATTSSGQTTGVTTGPDPLLPTVYCKGQPCDGGQVCCLNYFNEDQDFCALPGDCPNGNQWLEIGCNGPDDCPGQECCGQYDFGFGAWTNIECKSSCGGNEIELCFDGAAACDQGSVCTPSQSLGPGYSYCGD